MTDNPRITLTWPEVMRAGYHGLQRCVMAQQQGRQHLNGLERGVAAWGYDIEGSCAEMAVAKYLGVYWGPTPAPDDRQPDVAGIHVRMTTHRDGKLVIRQQDPDGIYLLVTGLAPTYDLRGWITAEDGRQRQWLDDPTRHRSQDRPAVKRAPAYFVPQLELNPVELLPPVGMLK